MSICRCRCGYTLIEMIVILVILGFMAGLALPRLEKVYTGMQRSMQRSEVLRCIADLGYQAWNHQQILILDHYPPKPTGSYEISQLQTSPMGSTLSEEVFPLPEGWKIVTESPILFKRNGVCSGGTITVSYSNLSSRYVLTAPLCTPSLVE